MKLTTITLLALSALAGCSGPQVPQTAHFWPPPVVPDVCAGYPMWTQAERLGHPECHG